MTSELHNSSNVTKLFVTKFHDHQSNDNKVMMGVLMPMTDGLKKPKSNRVKQDNAFNTMWWPVLSIDNCCKVTSLSVEKTEYHILFKASFCLSSLLPVKSSC